MIRGTTRAEKRHYEALATQARWIGLLGQCHPKHYPSVGKMLGEKPIKRMMAGREIGVAMRAWATRMG